MNENTTKIGTHFFGSLHNCAVDLSLISEKEIKNKISKIIKDSDLTELGSYYHTFDDFGLTGIVALAESHVAFHTWPKKKFVTVDIFTCNHSQDNSKTTEIAFEKLIEIFKPKKIERKRIVR